MFEAFLDESGMEKNISVVIAGIVGRNHECDLAAERWSDALQNAGVNKPFHSIEFWNRTGNRMHGPYKHLSISDGDLLATLFTEIVTSLSLRPIGIAVDARAFRGLSEDERRWLTTNTRSGKDWNSQGSPSNPYFFAFQACTQIAANEVPLGEKVYFTFDRQDRFADRARKLYNETMALKNEFTERMGAGIVFTDKVEAVLLQAADFVAYLSRWYAEDAKSMPVVASECFKQMAEPQDSKIYLVTPENLDELLRRCPFRKTFWEGLTKPDFVEQIRMSGYNVLAYRFGDVYLSHHIRPSNLRAIGRLSKAEAADGIERFCVEKLPDEDRNG